MTQSTPMSPEIKAFFDKTMPKSGKGHILALGEEHAEKDHITYLHDHLDELVEDHHLGTIGVEMRGYMNVFFWAYQDGTLTEMLGSKERAREYMEQIFAVEAKFQEGFIEKGQLLILALDKGVRVNAFDLRGEVMANFESISHIHKDRSETVAQEMRLDKANHPQNKRTHLWEKSELAMLCERHPVYKERIDRMLKLNALGDKKKIGVDAMSAVLFDVSLDKTKNSISISGDAHIDAKGNVEPHWRAALPFWEDHILHGTFPDHLRWLGNADGRGFFEEKKANVPVVHTAIMAGRGWMGKMLEHRASQIKKHMSESPRDIPTTTINIDTNEIAAFPKPEGKDVTPMIMRFMNPVAWDDSKLIDQRINPYLIPSIKQLADEIRADWNPGLGQERGATR